MHLLLRKHWPIVLLVVLTSIIAITNFTPGTILSGWDTLHPEFNYGLNLKRILFGVFREEQGLGAVAAHAHMAELPRIFLLFLFDIFLSMDMVRYSYIFFCLFLGPIGMYLFLKHGIFSKEGGSSGRAPGNAQPSQTWRALTGRKLLTGPSAQVPAFLGATFYLLNLGTLQQFILPFEMFTTLYAVLPFLFLFTVLFLRSESQRQQRTSLLLFCIATLLAAPSAYAPTLWYVHFLLFLVFGVCFVLLSPKKRLALKRLGLLLLLTLSINAFWWLPTLYFLFSHSQEVANAYINQLFSPQAFLYNKEFGNVKDLALLKSFLFDWSMYDKANGFVDVMGSWNQHLAKPFILLIGYTAAGFALLGLTLTLVKRNRVLLALLPLLAITFFFLLNQNGPTGVLYTALQDNLPLFKEALRFPHTKFYLHFILLFSVFFAVGQQVLFSAIAKVARSYKILQLLPMGLITAFLIYFMLPAFSGNLIHPAMRVTIPDSYFELFTWMNERSDTRRVAQLPIHSFWGWEYYDWKEKGLGFQGAGFLWFGMKQPLLNRDFDRWNIFNESYYREMSHAVYSENPALFQQVLEKYDIGYILVDTSVIAPQTEQIVLFQKEIAALLDQLPSVKKAKQFGDFLHVYTVETPKSHAFALTNAQPVDTTYTTSPFDPAKSLLGEYFLPDSQNPISHRSFPFANFTRRDGSIPPEALTITPDGVLVKLPALTHIDTQYEVQSLLENVSSLPADVFVKKIGATLRFSFFPYIFTAAEKQPLTLTTTISLPQNEENVLLNVNRTQTFVLGNLSENTDILLGRVQLRTQSENTLALYNQSPDSILTPDFSETAYSLRQCETVKKEQLFAIANERNGFELTAENTAVCMIVPFSELLEDIEFETERELFISTHFRIANSNQTESITSLCVANLQNGSCIDAQSSRFSLSPRVADFFTTSFGIRTDMLNTTGLRVFIDATKTKGPASVQYSEVTIGIHHPLYATSFAKETLELSLPALSTTLESSADEILFPFSGNTTFSTDITTLPRTSGECEQNPIVRHTSTKKYIAQEQNRFIRYEAEDGPMCDHFSYSNLSANTAHLLLITARNITGLPLTVCATNYYSKRCDAYVRLRPTDTLTTQAILIPPLGSTQTGYDINISNLGVKDSPAINDLSSIDLVPIPYAWLSSIQQIAQNAPLLGETSRIPLQASHPMPHLYRIQNPPNDTLLMIPVSFENGWHAYQTDSSLSRLVPFLFGKKIPSHVLVNSWANGWLLSPDTTGMHQGSVITVVFLPQYLSYLGLVLLILSFASLSLLTPVRYAPQT